MYKESKENVLQSESKAVHSVIGLGLLTILSGLVITLTKNYFNVWSQFNVIAHVLFGLGLLLPLSFYVFLHFKRTVGIRKPAVLFMGLLSVLIMIPLFFSGMYLVYFGASESKNYLFSIHSISAFFSILVVVLHLWFHKLSREKKNSDDKSVFITISKKGSKSSLVYLLVAYFFVIAITTLLYNISNIGNVSTVVEKYEYDYGVHPFRPSMTETENQKFVGENQIVKSEQCGACHQDIYEQWVSSAHRQAASDPAYVKNINLLEDNKGISATRYCEGCHAPVALLTGQLTPGGVHGGIQGSAANLEGVGCMGCHGIVSIETLDGTAGYKFSPQEAYLFDSSTNKIGQKIRNFLIRVSPDIHKTKMNTSVLSDPKLCSSCHEQFMDKTMNDWGWVKMQSTYKEWLGSHFSIQSEQIHGVEKGLTCQGCHFPLVAANDPSANEAGQVHSHRSVGANIILPWLNGDIEKFEEVKRFLQSSKLLVSIEKPNLTSNIFNNQFVDGVLVKQENNERPFFLYLGEKSKVFVSVTNQLVGHNFPTGTTDIQEAWLYFSVKDAEGREIYLSGEIGIDQTLANGTHTYKSTPIDRNGKHVWKHDLFRMTGEIYRNLIPPGKSDLVGYEFEVPSNIKSPVTIDVVLKYRKFNARYANWVLGEKAKDQPIVELARDSLVVPVLEKRPAVDVNNR